MALHVTSALQAWLDTVTLVGHAATLWDCGLPVIEDQVRGAGPLAGIVTALDHAQRQWSLIAACDMPLASPAQVAGLLEATAGCETDAVVPRTPDGRLQPLFAVYRHTALGPLSRALGSGTRRLATALDSVRWTELAVSDGRPFANVNRREDLALLR